MPGPKVDLEKCECIRSSSDLQGALRPKIVGEEWVRAEEQRSERGGFEPWPAMRTWAGPPTSLSWFLQKRNSDAHLGGL